MSVAECIADYSNVLDKLNIRISILSSQVEGCFVGRGYNRRYYVKVTNLKNNKSFNTLFHDSVFNYQNNIKLDKAEVFYCLLMDMQAYEGARDFADFMREYGYENDKQASKAYNGCRKTSEQLHDLFSNEELEKLCDEFEGF